MLTDKEGSNFCVVYFTKFILIRNKNYIRNYNVLRKINLFQRLWYIILWLSHLCQMPL